MVVLNENMLGVTLLSVLLATTCHLSVSPTVAEETNSTNKPAEYLNYSTGSVPETSIITVSTFPNYSNESAPNNSTIKTTLPNYSSESIPNDAIKPYYPRNVVKPYPTAKGRKSTRSEHSLKSETNDKKQTSHRLAKERKTKQKVNRGNHSEEYKKFSKHKNKNKISKHQSRLITKMRTTVTKNDIRTKVTTIAGEYYYEEYYVDVHTTKMKTQDENSMLMESANYTDAEQVRRNHDMETKFGHSPPSTGISTSEEPVSRLAEYESFGRRTSGVTPSAMPPFWTLDAGCVILIMVLSSSVNFFQIKP